MNKNDFELLIEPGIIGFYNSCEVTQIFLHRKSDKKNIHLFILACLEEKSFEEIDHGFLCNPININKQYSIGIQRYWLDIDQLKSTFENLSTNNLWDFQGDKSLELEKLRYIPKQYVPSNENVRLNNVLKNNFQNGTYILEFFDERKKTFDLLLKNNSLKLFNKFNDEIRKYVPIDLSTVSDRIGNIIFQFPISLLKNEFTASKNWKGINATFYWHPSLKSYPSCEIIVESILDKNYMGSSIANYNKESSQTIEIGNLAQECSVKVYREKPNLIIGHMHGTFLKGIDLNMSVTSQETRIFNAEEKTIELDVSSPTRVKNNTEARDYTIHINNTVYRKEKNQLEKILSFKQYRNGKNAINDLRKLIQMKDKNGVCLWDPFLTPQDILNTLYFSSTFNSPLKAIGALNNDIKKITNDKGKENKTIIEGYKKIFLNPKNNNYGLNLEFRVQHSGYGWGFHDRFLLFPRGKNSQAEVYSLGTSINSYGKKHHI